MKTAHAPVQTSAPAATPVSLVEAKAHLRVSHSDEDDLIQMNLDAAVAALDGWTGTLGRCMVTQTWRLDLDQFPAADVLALPFPDCASITSITYTDTNGDGQTLSAASYHLVNRTNGAAVQLADGQVWPNTDEIPTAVQVTAVYGYGAAADVPAALKAAILLHVGALYENRETMAEKVGPTRAYEALIAPYRRVM